VVKKVFSYVKKFLPLIGIFIFIYMIYLLDVHAVIEAFLSINPLFILLALPLTIPRVLVRNVAWKMIQEQHNIHIPFWDSLKIFLIGYFYGSITPSYVGQLMRIPYMKEKTKNPYGKLFVNSFLETTLHTISLYGMIVIGAILVIGTLPDLLYIAILWILILSLVLLFFIKKERGEKVFHFFIKLLIPSSLKDYFYQFVDTFYNDLPHVKNLIAPVLVGMVTWIIIFSQEYLIVMGLDLPIPYLYFLLLYPVANAAGFLPITFAGLGTREAVAVFIFTSLYPVKGPEILVVSFLGFIITDIFTGFIGLLVALKESRIVSIHKTPLFPK
jgi:glycosyltransferase 2 family protein